MAFMPESASDNLPPSNIYGFKNSESLSQFADSGDGGFYDSRDDMVGGTDNDFTAQDSRDFDLRTNPPVMDAASWSESGTLSQSSLA